MRRCRRFPILRLVVLLGASLVLSLETRSIRAQTVGTQVGLPARRVPPAFEMPTYVPYPTYPISRVESANDVTVYTADVNRVLCMAQVGGTYWLGTVYGVKRASKERNVERVYTQRDGLPGERIEGIWADTNSVFAAVRFAPDQVALCILSLNDPSDRWRVLATVRAERPNNYYSGYGPQYNQTGAIFAAGPRYAVLLARSALPQKDTFAVYDRAQNTVHAIPWEEAIQADFRQIQTTFAIVRNDALVLGTDIGLFQVRLTPEGTNWQRQLPDRNVTAGTATPDGSRVYVVTRKRSLYGAGEDPALFQVEAGHAPQRLSVPDAALDENAPTAFLYRPLFADAQTGLWLLLPSSNSSRMFRSGMQSAKLLHLYPNAPTWEAVSLSQPTPKDPSAPPTFGYHPPFLPDTAAVPDTVAAALALSRPEQADAPNMFGMNRDENAVYSVEWMRVRFPFWLSPPTTDELPDGVTEQLTDSPAPHPLPLPLDSKNAWLTEVGKGTVSLVRVPLADVPPLEIVPGAFSGIRPVRQRAFVTSPRARRYPLVLDEMPLHLSVRALAPVNDKADSYLVLHENGVALWQTRETGINRWRDVPVPRSSGRNTSFQPDFLFVAGSQNTIYLSDWLSPNLLRYDHQTQSFVATNTQRPRSGQPFGADANGVFWTVGNNNLEWLRFDNSGNLLAAPTKLELPAMPEAAQTTLVAVADGLIWVTGQQKAQTSDPQKYTPSSYVLRGYDPVRQTWTAPLPLLSQLYTNFGVGSLLRAGPNGTVFVAAGRDVSTGGKEFMIWRYAAATNTWSSVSQPLYLPHGYSVRLGPVSAANVWLLDNSGAYLWNLAVPNGTWQNEPAFPTLSDSSSEAVTFRTSEEGTPLFAGRSGLWHKRGSLWQEETALVKQILPMERRNPSIRVFLGANAVWAVGTLTGSRNSFLARIDRENSTPLLLDTRNGLPDVTYSNSLVFDSAGGVWVSGTTPAPRRDGVFRLAPGQTQFRFICDSVQAIAPGEADDPSVYLLRLISGYNMPALWRFDLARGSLGPFANPQPLTQAGALLAQNQRVLVGTSLGLLSVSRDGRDWKRIETGGVVPSRLLRADGNLWLASQRAAARLPAVPSVLPLPPVSSPTAQTDTP